MSAIQSTVAEAVTTAVQGKPDPVKLTDKNLSTDLKTLANKVILLGMDRYYAKDGIRDHEMIVARETGKVAAGVLEMAKQAARDSKGNADDAVTYFVLAKGWSERELRKNVKLLKSVNQDTKTPIEELCPPWAQACSRARKTLEARISPIQVDPVSHQEVFTTLNAYYKASEKPRGARHGGNSSSATTLKGVERGVIPEMITYTNQIGVLLASMKNADGTPNTDMQVACGKEALQVCVKAIADNRAAWVHAHPTEFDSEGNAVAVQAAITENAVTPASQGAQAESANKRARRMRGGSK